MSASNRRGGQSVAEFALVLPVLVAMIGGIVQFGMIFWAQNTLTQVVRDTGRWAATQQGCSTSTVNIAGEANTVAGNSSLIGYSTTWTATDETVTPGYTSAGDTTVGSFTTNEAVAVAWVKDSDATNEGCPPTDNQSVYHVTIKINHTIPIFFPGMQYLPGLGTCDSTGCHVVLSSTAQFRMEPAP